MSSGVGRGKGIWRKKNFMDVKSSTSDAGKDPQFREPRRTEGKGTTKGGERGKFSSERQNKKESKTIDLLVAEGMTWGRTRRLRERLI